LKVLTDHECDEDTATDEVDNELESNEPEEDDISIDDILYNSIRKCLKATLQTGHVEALSHIEGLRTERLFCCPTSNLFSP
jgi:hypothetical protein